MKSIFTILFFVFISGITQAQIVNIPDPNFKARLLQASPSEFIAFDANDNRVSIDTNNNGEIEVSEALNIFELRLKNQYISDLTGLEAFTNLTSLSCKNNNLSVIDISQNQNLSSLDVSQNQLSNIDISQNQNLSVLDVSQNQLSNIDISQNQNLERLLISGNDLTGIDISDNPDLLELNVQVNDLGNLEVSQNINLEVLNCRGTNLTSLNVSQNVNLKQLNFSSNEINTIDITQNPNLERLDCDFNNLSTIDITQNPNLERLSCSYNNLSNVDVTENLNLEHLDVSHNQLGDINISQNINLEYLRVTNINLTTLDVSQNLDLEYLRCDANYLTTLDITQNANLQQLNCSSNLLTNIELANNPNLNYLQFRYNQITDFDFSLLPNLTWFMCEYNYLTELDLSNNNTLGWWWCANNQITTINIKSGDGYSFYPFFDEGIDLTNNPIEFICADEEEILDFQQFANYQGPISSYCSFVPGGDYNSISGTLNLDLDSNGCDDSDYEIPNIRLNLDDETTLGATFSNQLGEYTFYTEIGNFQLTPELENPGIFNVTPLNVDIDFTDLNNTVNQNFCITANGIHNDLEIVIVPTVPAQPGFDASYQLVCKNKGNQVLSGSVEFDYNETVLDFLSTSVTPTSQNTGSLSWDYADLYPFESRVVDIVFNVNSQMETPVVNIDDILDFTATINPIADDYTPVDNTFTLNQVVVGSYDPNDITCLEGDIVSPDKIGEYLHYNIRFENTGTAPATFVVVRDDINETQYDLGSLQVLNSSHDMYTRITGNRVEFIFDDINLAPEEIGNVLFKIKSLETLNTGDEVAQQAEIYFDYNFPIIANIAQTSYQALSINEFDLNDSVEIFPNPATDFIRIKSDNVLQSLNVYDVHGRLVLQESLSNKETSVSLSSFKSGVYFIEVHSNSGIVIKRLIKN